MSLISKLKKAKNAMIKAFDLQGSPASQPGLGPRQAVNQVGSSAAAGLLKSFNNKPKASPVKVAPSKPSVTPSPSSMATPAVKVEEMEEKKRKKMPDSGILKRFK